MTIFTCDLQRSAHIGKTFSLQWWRYNRLPVGPTYSWSVLCRTLGFMQWFQTLFVVDPRLVEADVEVKPLLNNQPTSHRRHLIDLKMKWMLSNSHVYHWLVQQMLWQSSDRHNASNNVHKQGSKQVIVSELIYTVQNSLVEQNMFKLINNWPRCGQYYSNNT